MRISVCGMDPSLTAWGIAESFLDLTTGELDTPRFQVIEPEREDSKQVRKNSKDLSEATQLATIALAAARKAKVVFVECPVGSQSARAMCGYGVCVGILGTIISEGIPLIEVQATDVKHALSGMKHATKDQMIAAAVAAYPDAIFPTYHGKITKKAEHAADALGSIYAGVHTSSFQGLLRLLQHKEP